MQLMPLMVCTLCNAFFSVRPHAMFTDNVGDNVGDIAGMGSDLFGSLAESTCAALVVSSVSSLGTQHNWVAMSYPMLITASGIVVSLFVTFIATDLKPARLVEEIETTLKNQLIISTILMTPVRAPPAEAWQS